MMLPTYEHKEKCGIFGILLWLAAIISPFPCFFVYTIASREGLLKGSFEKALPICLVLIVLGNFIMALVSSLFTVKIEDNIFSIVFGNGIFHKKIDTREIKAVKSFETKYQFGLLSGKKVSKDTKLYSIGNKNIVEVELHSGKKIQIGTDQPEELTQAIKSVIS